MRFPRHLVVLAALLSFGMCRAAGAAEAPLAQAAQEAEERWAASTETRGLRRPAGWRQLVEEGKYGALKELLSISISRTEDTEAKDALRSLLQRLELEQRERARVLRAEVDKLMDDTRALLLAARAPAELDGTLAAMARLQRQVEGWDGLIGEEVRRMLSEARQFAAGWQSYLHLQSAGQPAEIRSLLETLAQQSVNQLAPLLPRSEVLRRMPAQTSARRPAAEKTVLQTTRSKLEQAKSLADLRKVLIELNAVDETGELDPSARHEFSQMIRPLTEVIVLVDAMERTKEAELAAIFKAAEAVQIQFPSLGARLREELVNRAMSFMLNSPLGGVRPNESRRDYLLRVSAHAEQQRDWALFVRAARLREQLGDGRSSSLSRREQERDGYAQLLAGDNFERAGQMLPAAVAYLETLRLCGPDAPVAFLRERLDFIKAKYPEAFEQATKQSLQGRSLR